MVSGISISSPLLVGISKAGTPALRGVVARENAVKTSSPAPLPAKVSPGKSSVSGSNLPAIIKSVQKNETILTSGNTAVFLQAVEKLINAALPGKPPETRLRINLDKKSGRFVYQGVDIKTGKVLTQFPADEILKELAFIRKREKAYGLVVDRKV